MLRKMLGPLSIVPGAGPRPGATAAPDTKEIFAGAAGVADSGGFRTVRFSVTVMEKSDIPLVDNLPKLDRYLRSERSQQAAVRNVAASDQSRPTLVGEDVQRVTYKRTLMA